MAIESKNLLVWVKAMSRGTNLPLDSTEVHESLDAAKEYINSPTAYPGQTIKVLVDGEYKEYLIQPGAGGYTLKEVGSDIASSDLKQYVQMPDALPTSGQEQGVIYIVGNTGSIWNGTEWKTIFADVSTDVADLTTSVETLETEVDKKAPINNAAFTGTVTVEGKEIATKEYADGLIANLTSSVPGIVGTDNPLPTSGYKAGQTFRVADAGVYAGQECEAGDLIIVLADYNADTASDNDFMVVQANIDGAVTSSADASTVGEIVVYDAVTGKVIKGSGVNISSLNDAIAKAHEHTNKAVLDTYDKTQTELLTSAADDAQSKLDTYAATVTEALSGKSDTDHTHDDRYYTETEIDAKIKTITDNLNTKVDSSTVDTKIETAKEEITTAYETAISDKVGEIPDGTTVKQYVDTAVGSGGTASAEAIATAKQEAISAAKEYTDAQITSALTVTEF